MASTSTFNDEPPKKRQCLNGTIDYSEYSNNQNDDIPVRLVCIDGTPPHTIDEIREFFGQFGEIESIGVQSGRLNNKPNHLVQFKHEADARKALLHTKESWCGFEVKAVEPLNQPDHPLQIAPPEPDSDSNIVNALNEDCTQHVFKRLKLTDLTNVAEVCKRFNEQAKITFASKHTHLDFPGQFNYDHCLMETAMKHFGKDIQSLFIEGNTFVPGMVAIGELCGPKLKRLEFRCIRFKSDSLALRPIFDGLEQLKLDACDGIDLEQLMVGCAELKSLTLSYRNGDRYIEQTFPKLQEISIQSTKISDEIFENFIIRHPTLIKLSILSILSIDSTTLTSHAFRSIGQHAKNLQELKFSWVHDTNANDDQFKNDVAFLGQLNSLKNLQFGFKSPIIPAWNRPIICVLNALVTGGVPIECLEIRFEDQPVGDVIKCISRMKQLKNLRLKTESCKRLTDTDAIELVKYLPVLEELHLEEIHYGNRSNSDYEFKSRLSTIGLRKILLHANKLKLLELRSIDSIKIGIDDYKMMLDTVQKRNEVVPLVIEIARGKEVNVPAAVLAEHQNVFNIKKLKY